MRQLRVFPLLLKLLLMRVVLCLISSTFRTHVMRAEEIGSWRRGLDTGQGCVCLWLSHIYDGGKAKDT
jgi:hypothetical protein